MMEFLTSNWDTIVACSIAFIASVDKIAMLAINAAGNIRDTWNVTFPAKVKEEKNENTE